MPDVAGLPRPQPINNRPSGLKINNKKINHGVTLWLYIALAVVIFTVIGVVWWYNYQLSPVGKDAGLLKKITIAKGSTSSQIGQELERQSIIRNSFIFEIYTRVSGKNGVLQAGTYRLSPAESVPQIVDHLEKGSVDQFSITFYPGDTLAGVVKVLKKAGYTDTEINVALETTYDSPLFVDKPPSADLEGYVYGETYKFNIGMTAEEVLKRTFDHFYSVIQNNELIVGFQKHGLNLYQGITLASIVQRELNDIDDQRQAAQVFYSRLSSGMPLGSDVTYQYVADKEGLERSPDLDSPYNTRRYNGLPPGPISVPGLTALQAVANPAKGDYLYFLSGDDNITYFARTYAEHEANIKNHCVIKCAIQ
jgi:UPF0755 protein